MTPRIGSLFSGVGGLELGLERATGGSVVWQVEQDEWCRGILARHWPKAERFNDVCDVGAANLAEVDVICGGFPCTDLSFAGPGAGLAGARSGLWWEYARIVRELRPRVVVVENVAALLVRGVGRHSRGVGRERVRCCLGLRSRVRRWRPSPTRPTLHRRRHGRHPPRRTATERVRCSVSIAATTSGRR